MSISSESNVHNNALLVSAALSHTFGICSRPSPMNQSGMRYEKLKEQGSESEEESHFLPHVEANDTDRGTESRPRQVRRWKIMAFGSCLISTILALALFVLTWRHKSTSGIVCGYGTDFVSARNHIELTETSWRGAPMIHDSGEFFVPHLATKFSGPSRPELDEAWDNLTISTYIRITESEAQETWGHSYGDFWNKEREGYVVGLEMFHTLHCLNRIRRSLDPEYYNFKGYEKFNDENHAIHREHCIQQIRQYIMCAGDMTPLSTRYSPATDRNYVYSDTTHTCRNFDMLKNWADSRHHGELEVAPYQKSSKLD